MKVKGGEGCEGLFEVNKKKIKNNNNILFPYS
jgi:hypothetical protein